MNACGWCCCDMGEHGGSLLPVTPAGSSDFQRCVGPGFVTQTEGPWENEYARAEVARCNRLSRQPSDY